MRRMGLGTASLLAAVAMLGMPMAPPKREEKEPIQPEPEPEPKIKPAVPIEAVADDIRRSVDAMTTRRVSALRSVPLAPPQPLRDLSGLEGAARQIAAHAIDRANEKLEERAKEVARDAVTRGCPTHCGFDCPHHGPMNRKRVRRAEREAQRLAGRRPA